MKPALSNVCLNVSYSLLAKQTGFTRTHCRRMLAGKNRATLESAAKIADAMNITLDELYWHIEAVKIARRMEVFSVASLDAAAEKETPRARKAR